MQQSGTSPARQRGCCERDQPRGRWGRTAVQAMRGYSTPAWNSGGGRSESPSNLAWLIVLEGIDQARTVEVGADYLAKTNPHSGAPARLRGHDLLGAGHDG